MRAFRVVAATCAIANVECVPNLSDACTAADENNSRTLSNPSGQPGGAPLRRRMHGCRERPGRTAFFLAGMDSGQLPDPRFRPPHRRHPRRNGRQGRAAGQARQAHLAGRGAQTRHAAHRHLRSPCLGSFGTRRPPRRNARLLQRHQRLPARRWSGRGALPRRYPAAGGSHLPRLARRHGAGADPRRNGRRRRARVRPVPRRQL